MNRQQCAQLAAETVAICDAGFYDLPDGSCVSIRSDLEKACAATALYLPDDYATLRRDLEGRVAPHATKIAVSGATTLEAARALAEEYESVAALNFASAKNAGGGFLSGSQAQEESLARASGLYAALQMQPDFYEFHRAQRSAFYSDRVIFAPQVPVFRDDSGKLLPQSWNADFLTAAAVNAGALRQNEAARAAAIASAMEQRTRMVLAVAAHRGCEALVLGAWGCGVFRNEPQSIARVFHKVLAEPLFANRFARIEFAIYDPAPPRDTLRAFQNVFAP